MPSVIDVGLAVSEPKALIKAPDRTGLNSTQLSWQCAANAVMRYLCVCVCVCVSVCLSVTFVDHVKTNKHIFEIFSPSGSHTFLVFPYQTWWRYSDGNPPNCEQWRIHRGGRSPPRVRVVSKEFFANQFSQFEVIFLFQGLRNSSPITNLSPQDC